MKELNDIIQAYDKALQQHKRAALVSVVKVEGSSYRRPGARMLVTEDGEITGAISGGCLEGDALRKAQYAMLQQQNKLEIYDTTDDEDNQLGIQLGCNGIVYILFEPINTEHVHHPVNLLKKLAEQRKDAVVVTAFNPNKNAVQKGTFAYYSDDGSHTGDMGHAAQDGCKTVLQQKASVLGELEDDFVLYQYIPPALQLVVIGAGNDVQPLVEMAALLGWKTMVVDGRPSYATRQRFPKANEVRVARSTEFLSVFTIDAYTAIVLMTHNYNYDEAALHQLVQTDCRYIGVLGPRKKLYKMLDRFNDTNNIADAIISKNIYGPVGLDIGSETAEEIALSIIAEIKAVFSATGGTFLRDKPSAIHARDPLGL